MKTDIIWIEITNQVIEDGWYLIVRNPDNYKELDEMNDWRELYGCQRLWRHNGKWWDNHRDITEFITHYSELPKVPKFYKDEETKKLHKKEVEEMYVNINLRMKNFFN